jgi:hypothetical protein
VFIPKGECSTQGLSVNPKGTTSPLWVNPCYKILASVPLFLFNQFPVVYVYVRNLPFGSSTTRWGVNLAKTLLSYSCLVCLLAFNLHAFQVKKFPPEHIGKLLTEVQTDKTPFFKAYWPIGINSILG